MRGKRCGKKRFVERRLLAGLATGAFLAQGAVAIGADQGAGVDSDNRDVLQCRLVRIDSPNRVELRGVVTASAPIEGGYALSLSKSDGAGVSTQRQGGRFAFAAPGETVVTRTLVSLAPGGRVEATLRVTAGDFETTCALVREGAPGDATTET